MRTLSSSSFLGNYENIIIFFFSYQIMRTLSFSSFLSKLWKQYHLLFLIKYENIIIFFSFQIMKTLSSSFLSKLWEHYHLLLFFGNYESIIIFFLIFVPTGHICTVFSGVGIVCGTPHPVVWDTHTSS